MGEEQPVEEEPMEHQGSTTEMVGDVSVTTAGMADALEVSKLNWDQDDYGYIYVVGMLKNTGSEDLDFVEVQVNLRDANNNMVATASGYTSMDILRAGEDSPFIVSFYEPPYDDWQGMEIFIQADQNEYFESYSDLEVINVETAVDDIYYVINGEVQNTGSQATSSVSISVAVYNTAGDLIGVDFTFADAEVLEPGETAPFELYVWATFDGEAVDHFDAYLEGYPVVD